MVNRPSWDEYFMQITEVVARRSTCLRRQVGAVIIKDQQILTTGYNGAPRGMAHCLDVGCLREQLGVPSGQRHEICRGMHAEQNAIVQAAYHGVGISGGTIYCTHQPCFICAKMIINAGLVRVVFLNSYPDDLAAAALAESSVEVENLLPSPNL